MFNKEKLREIVELYKEQFPQWWIDEKFKWQAVKYFQENWDIQAVDFQEMLSRTLNHNKVYYSLFDSAGHYPIRMITGFAKKDPESVRSMFIDLFDESKDLFERIDRFKSKSKDLLQETGNEGKSHFQDENCITTYLWLKYPEKYYIYKIGEIKEVVKALEEKDYFFKKGAYESNIRNSIKLYNEICEELSKDTELVNMFKSLLDDTCDKDVALRTLTFDFGFYISRKYKDDKIVVDDPWWPSLEEYNPRLSKEKWLEILNDSELTHPAVMAMFNMMLEQGGQSSCAKLAEIYGNVHNYYNKLGSSYGERVLKKYNLPLLDDNGVKRYFVVPFVGKDITEDGKVHFCWKLRPELKAALEELDLLPVEVKVMQTDINQNTILYGPPGTGKTYNTARYAVAIVENKPLEEIEELEYKEVLKKYNEYKAQGRIEFTTFHQAFGYEEFIEGIKPVVESSDEDSNDIKYEIAPGLFKKFCDNATTPNINSNVDMGLNKNPTVWKVSLWSTGDNPIRTECIENGHIRVGWDEYGPDITSETDFSKAGGKKVLNSFIYKMKQGDIVLSCYSNTTVDAIGVVTSDYEWHEEYDYLKRLRKVNWLVKGKNENIVDMNNGKTFTLATVYKSNISVFDALSIVQKYSDYSEGVKSEKQNHVFIIDEINRGNISKIFGELITLIEPSKRVGASEELKAVLPYSQMLFGVPDNVYILGTMNTADRSIAMLDTALRRRFDFVEMMPDAEILKGIDVEGIDISKMLEVMNKRIEVLFDREHTIGHTYFIGLKDNNDIETLANIFKNKVIPLLQEYFYEDYEKIRLVLADNQSEDEAKQFIKIEDLKIKDLFGKNDIDILDDPKKYYINDVAFKNKDAYIKIYNK